MTRTFGPYSPIRQAGDVYFVSGQIGADPETKRAYDDVASQTGKALENLKAALATENLTLDDVVKTTIFVTDLGDFAIINEVYLKHFTSEPRPARSTVGVKELPRVANVPLKVEIEAIAQRRAS
jgi:2-iminobutanoate/2-iminopropanoate deaminase